jgi:D-3-phosphoglycerate dehydrogenase
MLPLMAQKLISIGFTPIEKAGITYEQLLAEIKDYEGIIISTRTKIDKRLIDVAPKLKFVGRVGSGMEHVDIDYCTKKGIRCFSSPEGNANAVGEHCLGMLLALIRNMRRSQNELLQNIWKRKENTGFELDGKTIGIIGFGHTGPAFAKKLQGFDTKLLILDPFKNINETAQIKNSTLSTIQKEADIISFHVPYNKKTHHYIDKIFIANCIKKPILINTSRGAMAKTEDLFFALENDLIRGLCIDVYEDEPLDKGIQNSLGMYKNLISFDNVIATSHIAGWTWEAKEKMINILVEKIKNGFC